MAHTASETAGGWRQTLVDTVKANPLPAAVVGLGLGWMFLNRPSQAQTASYGSPARAGRYAPPAYGSGVYGGGGFEPVSSERMGVDLSAEDDQLSVSRVADKAQQTAGQVAGQVQGTAEHVIDQVQETGGQVVDQVQTQASRAQSFLQRQLEENPLLVGAVALALGGVLASTIPVTPREDQIMGEARDRVMGTARELTHDTMDKVGRVVDEVQSAAKTEAQNQSLVP